ncbi:MAG TPA: helix-turn-helix transcriptional regulator [Streptosporangiaceae bacterium]|jgi:transcriptional regulator with XRE-family HTH domain
MSGQSFNEQLLTEIRAEMGRQRMSQRELCRRLDWPSSTGHRRLAGYSPLSAEDLHKIAQVLDVPITQLGFPLLTTSGSGVR